jgi:hypothetical protein
MKAGTGWSNTEIIGDEGHFTAVDTPKLLVMKASFFYFIHRNYW